MNRKVNKECDRSFDVFTDQRRESITKLTFASEELLDLTSDDNQNSDTFSMLESINNLTRKEKFKEAMVCMNEEPSLKPILDGMENGGPAASMKYQNDPEVLQKVGLTMGMHMSAEAASSVKLSRAEEETGYADGDSVEKPSRMSSNKSFNNPWIFFRYKVATLMAVCADQRCRLFVVLFWMSISFAACSGQQDCKSELQQIFELCQLQSWPTCLASISNSPVCCQNLERVASTTDCICNPSYADFGISNDDMVKLLDVCRTPVNAVKEVCVEPKPITIVLKNDNALTLMDIVEIIGCVGTVMGVIIAYITCRRDIKKAYRGECWTEGSVLNV